MVMRDVMEFRSDGTYTSGLCLTGNPAGWCMPGGATGIVTGRYDVMGDELMLRNGLAFRMPDATGQPKALQWGVELVPDDPPTGNPPSKKLRLLPDYPLFGDMKVEPGWR